MSEKGQPWVILKVLEEYVVIFKDKKTKITMGSL